MEQNKRTTTKLEAENRQLKKALKDIKEICQDNVNHYDDVIYADVHNEFQYLVDEVEKVI